MSNERHRNQEIGNLNIIATDLSFHMGHCTKLVATINASTPTPILFYCANLDAEHEGKCTFTITVGDGSLTFEMDNREANNRP